eukprot:scaffold379_cov235-Pinguiococcus_pyrenoidosus.AAC.18
MNFVRRADTSSSVASSLPMRPATAPMLTTNSAEVRSVLMRLSHIASRIIFTRRVWRRPSGRRSRSGAMSVAAPCAEARSDMSAAMVWRVSSRRKRVVAVAALTLYRLRENERKPVGESARRAAAQHGGRTRTTSPLARGW